MHNAPSVTYPVGRSTFSALLHLFAGLAGLVAAGLASQSAHVGVSWWVWVLWAIWCALAWRSWRLQPQGRLQWSPTSAEEPADGGHRGAWFWQSAAYQHGVGLRKVEQVYDLQRRVLLRLYNPDGVVLWVWVERSADPLCWDDLRRALRAAT